MSLLKVDDLQVGYGNKNVIQNVSFELNEGMIAGVLGPNGCGKSTLIKALCKGISGKGNVYVCGQDINEMSEKELARFCSYVPQRSGLSIDISVFDVVLMGFYPYMSILERPSRKMREKACEILKRVGLDNEIESNYMELSEGQKRLCILARSLVADAKLMIMDEPDASLDFIIRNNLINIIKERVEDSKTGVLLSLHDVDLALSCCDEIYLMNEGKFISKIAPKNDDLSEIEHKLSQLYGNIKLLEYNNKFIMVQA